MIPRCVTGILLHWIVHCTIRLSPLEHHFISSLAIHTMSVTNKRKTTRQKLLARLLRRSLRLTPPNHPHFDGVGLLRTHVDERVVLPPEVDLLTDGTKRKVVLRVGGGVDEST